MPSTIQYEAKSESRLAFFELLFGLDEGYVCIATTNQVNPKTTFEQTFFEWPNQSIKLENFILKNESTKNVYFCINLLSKMERKKAHCLPTNLVWADLDGVNPDTINTIPPSIVVQSSPARWQAFWRMTSKLDASEAEKYSKRIAYSVEADVSGWDLTQLFRVPFTTNFKYKSPVPVVLERALEVTVKPLLFEMLPKPKDSATADSVEPMPTESERTPEEIIAHYMAVMDIAHFASLYNEEPDDDTDWSTVLWHLIHICYKAGMNEEEVFVIANSASCNKYARDGRPLEHLWRDVLKAGGDYGKLPPEKSLMAMPHLVDDRTINKNFVDEYCDWANEATDAVSEFHELSAFIILSAIISNSVRLETSYGRMVPNIWGLMLGESTVSRKTTAMNMAIKLLSELDNELIIATDGSAEGLVTGLSSRPNKVSIYYRDEVTGLFDGFNKKDYMAALPEMLTALYDVPQHFSRLLRKEVIRVESPAFIFFGGGIRDRTYATISDSWIRSGFIPRFLVVSGDFEEGRLRPTGPPTELGLLKRSGLVSKLADLYQNYAAEVMQHVGGQVMTVSPQIAASLTPAAWDKYQALEHLLTMEGYNSLIREEASPTFDRLARSLLKLAIIIGAARQEPVDGRIEIEERDVIDAAWYIQKWGVHSVNLVLNAGKSHREKYYDRVLNKIRNNPGVMRSTIMQHHHLNKKEADDILHTLEERGQVRKQKQGKGWRYWVQ